MSSETTYETRDHVVVSASYDLSSAGPSLGTVVLAHGITVARDEDPDSTGVGVFAQLSALLASAGFNVLRFDFRGHGQSNVPQEQMTIRGELCDLRASVDYARERWDGPLSIVAASFGATSTLIHATEDEPPLSLVLWNPVLDLEKTFLKPTVPWARDSFNDVGWAHLRRTGYLLLDDHFRIGQGLVAEMATLRPYVLMEGMEIPVLTFHGTADSYVPFDVSEASALRAKRGEFVAIEGSDHGFGKREDLVFVLRETVHWLVEQHSSIKKVRQ